MKMVIVKAGKEVLLILCFQRLIGTWARSILQKGHVQSKNNTAPKKVDDFIRKYKEVLKDKKKNKI